MEQSQLVAHCGSSKITREELKLIPTPEASATHQPIPHNQIVEALVESLSFRHISAMREEYAVSDDGMKMFGARNTVRRARERPSDSQFSAPCVRCPNPGAETVFPAQIEVVVSAVPLSSIALPLILDPYARMPRPFGLSLSP